MAEPEDVLDRIPVLRSERRSVTRLGGLSNTSYRVETPSGRYVLRVPEPGPGPFVDRANEIAATRIAAGLGIGAPLVHAAPDGVMVTRWIDGAHPMSAAAYATSPDAVERLGRSLARLHMSPDRFPGTYDPARIVRTYADACIARHGHLPWDGAVADALLGALASIARSGRDAVPSHCDLVPENCLDDGARMVLVDWEFAGMADPAWDLAYAALEGGFDARQRRVLLAAYGPRAPSETDLRPMSLAAAAINGLWEVLRSPHPGNLSGAAARRLAVVRSLVPGNGSGD
ncbi:MAG: choline kinase family protein [Microvirga sp.]